MIFQRMEMAKMFDCWTDFMIVLIKERRNTATAKLWMASNVWLTKANVCDGEMWHLQDLVYDLIQAHTITPEAMLGLFPIIWILNGNPKFSVSFEL